VGKQASLRRPKSWSEQNANRLETVFAQICLRGQISTSGAFATIFFCSPRSLNEVVSPNISNLLDKT
jgi:hypothetical protein